MREKKIEHNVIMDVKILIDQVARYGKVENQNCVREAHGCFLVHYNKRARSLTLISTPGTSFLPLSPPPPIRSSSLQFHLLLHTRPILSISSLFFQILFFVQ